MIYEGGEGAHKGFCERQFELTICFTGGYTFSTKPGPSAWMHLMIARGEGARKGSS